MANRIVPNDRYGARELRRPVQGHPPLDRSVARPGEDPPELNPVQPLPTPETQRRKCYGSSAAVPIHLAYDQGHYGPPPSGAQLHAGLAFRKQKLRAEVVCIANNEGPGEQWLAEKAHLQLGELDRKMGRMDVRPFGFESRDMFEEKCSQDLRARFIHLGRHRSYLSEPRIAAYLDSELSIIDAVERASKYHKHIYGGYADIANRNFRGLTPHRVTLNRLLEPLMCLPESVSPQELVNTSFDGLVSAADIFLDHYAVADLLSLASALGWLAHGKFAPTPAQAYTYLRVVVAKIDDANYSLDTMMRRRELADLIEGRLSFLSNRDHLVDNVCRSVIANLPMLVDRA